MDPTIRSRAAEGVENELNPFGLTSIICPVYPGTPRERDYVESLVDAGVAAIVFLSSSNTLRDEDHRVVQFVSARTCQVSLMPAEAPVRRLVPRPAR